MMLKLILLEELALAGAPFGPLAGADQTAESIIRDGSTPYLQCEILPRIGRGEVTFWQGFSEPGAGSDLLSLTTEARRDGDHYVIRRPQDLDESRRHRRLRPRAGAHRAARRAAASGLSMFVVANGTPGMDIRPIRSLTGEVYHYEVFLDDVRVPADRCSGARARASAQLLRGSTPTGSGAASTRPRRSSACSASSWNTPTARRATAPSSRAIPACGARPRRARRRDRGAAAPLLPRGRMIETGEPSPRVGAGQGDGRRAGPEARRLRHGSARPLRPAHRRPRAGRRSGGDDPARLPDEPRPHHRRRHLGDPAHHGGDARASACPSER